MKFIPPDSYAARIAADERATERARGLEAQQYKFVPAGFLRETVRAVHGIFSSNSSEQWQRLENMKAIERRFMEGISILRSFSSRLVGEALTREPGTTWVTDIERDNIKLIIMLLASDQRDYVDHPDSEACKKERAAIDRIHQHLELTGAYAFQLTTELNRIQRTRMNAFAADLMGRLRNIAMLLGIRSYGEKTSRSKKVIRQLGIHEGFIDQYLMPADAYMSGVSPEEYAEMSGMERQAAADRRMQNIWSQLSQLQKLLELSGFMAKQEGGRLLTFDEAMQLHEQSRQTPQQYMQATGSRPVFAVGRRTTSCLNPEFAGVWGEKYVEMRMELEQMGVDFEHLRQKVARDSGLRL